MRRNAKKIDYLLFLVPLVAIAFDLYIVSDDFRVKRVGAFLQREESGSCFEEKEWEKYVNGHDNRFAPFAFFIVTFILTIAATIVFIKNHFYFAIPWFVILLLIDGWLLHYSLQIRSELDEKAKCKPKEGLEKKSN